MKKLLRLTGDRSNPVLTLFFAVVALAALVGAQVADAQNGTAPAFNLNAWSARQTPCTGGDRR